MKRLLCLLILSGCTMKKAPDLVQLSIAELMTAPASCVTPGAALVAVHCDKGTLDMAELQKPVKAQITKDCSATFFPAEILKEDQTCRVLADQIRDKQMVGFQMLQQKE